MTADNDSDPLPPAFDPVVFAIEEELERQCIEAAEAPHVGAIDAAGGLIVNGTIDLVALAGAVRAAVYDGALAMERAARGDLTAQRDMIEWHLAAGRSGDVDYTHAVTQAEFWARVAIMHGGVQDERKFIELLALRSMDALDRGDTSLAKQYAQEHIARCSLLADAGDEEAALELNRLSEAAGPHHLEAASNLLKFWRSKLP